MATAIESVAHLGFEIPSLTRASPVIEKPRRVLDSYVPDFSAFHDFFVRIFEDSNLTFDVYNPSNAFEDLGNLYRAFRVDASDGRTKSCIFLEKDHKPVSVVPISFDLEDPFAVKMRNGEIIFGGVDVKHSLNEKNEKVSTGKTLFHRGTTLMRLEPFFAGPEGMKDIRLAERKDNTVCVYTRPRNPENEILGGNGKVGFRTFSSIDELARSSSSSLSIHNAPPLPFRYDEGHWRGINHAIVTEEGKYEGWNFLLGHLAWEEEGPVNPYDVTGSFHNPDTGELVDKGVLVTASDSPEGPSRSPRHDRVRFPGGIDFDKKTKTATIALGSKDKQALFVVIPSPLY